MIDKDNQGIVLPLRLEYKIIDDFKKSLAKRPWEYLEEGNYEKYLKLSETKKDVSTHRKELISVYSEILNLLKVKQKHVNLQFSDPKFDLVKHDYKCICNNTIKFRYLLDPVHEVDGTLSKQKSKHTGLFEREAQINYLEGVDGSDKYEKPVIVSSRADSELNAELKDPAVEKYFDANSVVRTGTKMERTGTKLLKRKSTVVRGGTKVFHEDSSVESREKSQNKVKFDVSDDVKSYDLQSDLMSEAPYEASVSRNYETDRLSVTVKSEPEIVKKQTYNSEYLMQLPSLDLETLHANKQSFKAPKKAKKAGDKEANRKSNIDSKDEVDGKSRREALKEVSGSGERSEKVRHVIGEKMDKKTSARTPKLGTLEQALADDKISHQEAEMKNDLMHLLETVAVFSDLPKSRLLDMSKHFKLRSYFTNSSIILAGEFPQEFFIVSSGTVSSYKYENNALFNVYQRSYLCSDYFGELFLMNNTASDEFFIADSHVTVQAMNANTFRTLLSDLFDAFRYRLKEFTNYGTCRFNTVAVPSRFFTNVEIDKFSSNDDVVKAHKIIGSGLIKFLRRYPFLEGFKNLEKLAKRFSYHEYLQKEILEGLGKKENLFLVYQGVVSLQVYEHELNSQLEMISFSPGSYFLTCKFHSDVVCSLMERASFVAKEKLILLCLEQKYVSKYLRGSVDQMVLYLENLYKSKYLKLEKDKYKSVRVEVSSDSGSSRNSSAGDREKSSESCYDRTLSRALKTRNHGSYTSDAQSLHSSSSMVKSESAKSLKSPVSEGSFKTDHKAESNLDVDDDKMDLDGEVYQNEKVNLDKVDRDSEDIDESSCFSSSSFTESRMSSGDFSHKSLNDDTSSIQSSRDGTSPLENEDGSSPYTKDTTTEFTEYSSGDAQSKNDTGSSKNDTVTQTSKQDSASLGSNISVHEEDVPYLRIQHSVLDAQEMMIVEEGKTLSEHGSLVDQPGLAGKDVEIQSSAGRERDSDSSQLMSSDRFLTNDERMFSRSFKKQVVSSESFKSSRTDSLKSSHVDSPKSGRVDKVESSSTDSVKPSKMDSSRFSELGARIVSRRSFEDPAEVSIRSSARTDSESARLSDFGAKVVSRRSFEEPAQVSIRSSARSDLESARLSEFGARVVSRRSFEDPADVSIRSSLNSQLDSSRASEFEKIVSRRSMEDPADVSIMSSLVSPLESSRTASSVHSNNVLPGSRIPTIYENVEEEAPEGENEETKKVSQKSSSDRGSMLTFGIKQESIDKTSLRDPDDHNGRFKGISEDYEIIRKNTLLASHVNISDTEISFRSQRSAHMNDGKQPISSAEEPVTGDVNVPEESVPVQGIFDYGLRRQQSSFTESFRSLSNSMKESSNFGRDSKDSDVSSVASDVKFIFNLDKLNKDKEKKTHSLGEVISVGEVSQDGENLDSSRVMGNDNFVDIRSLSQSTKLNRAGTNVGVPCSAEFTAQQSGAIPESILQGENVSPAVLFNEKSQMSDRMVHRQTSSSYLITSRTFNESFDPNELSVSSLNENAPFYLNEQESVPADKYVSGLEEVYKSADKSSKTSQKDHQRVKDSSRELDSGSSAGSKHNKSSLASKSRNSSIESIISKSYPSVEESINSVLEKMRSRSVNADKDRSLGKLKTDEGVDDENGRVKDGTTKDSVCTTEGENASEILGDRLPETVERSNEEFEKSPSLDFAEIPNLTKIISRVHSLYVSPEIPEGSVSGSKFSSIEEVYLHLDKIEKLYPGKSPNTSISPKSSIHTRKSNELNEKPAENDYVKSGTGNIVNVDPGEEIRDSMGGVQAEYSVQSDLNKLYRHLSNSSLNTLTNLNDSDQNRDDSLNTNMTTNVYVTSDQNEPSSTNEAGDSNNTNDEKSNENKSSISLDNVVGNLTEQLSMSSLGNELSIGNLTRDLSIENLTRGLSMDTLSEHLSLQNITKELSNIGSSISSQLSGAFSSKSSENNESDENKQDLEHENEGFSIKETSKLIITSIFDNIPIYNDKSAKSESESVVRQAESSENEHEIKDIKKEVDEFLSDENVFIDKYNLVSRISFDSSSPATFTSCTDRESVEATEKSSISSSGKQNSLRSEKEESVSGVEDDALNTPVLTQKVDTDSSLISLKQESLLTTESAALTSESGIMTSENQLLTSENEDRFSLVTTEKDDREGTVTSEKDEKQSFVSSDRGALVSSDSVSDKAPSDVSSNVSYKDGGREADRVFTMDKVLESSVNESVNDTSNLSTESESHMSMHSYSSSEERGDEDRFSTSESNQDNGSEISLTSENTYTSRKSSSSDSRSSSIESFNTKTSSVTPSGDGLESRSGSLESENSRAGSDYHSKPDEENDTNRTESEDNNLESSDQSEEGLNYEKGSDDERYEHFQHQASQSHLEHENDEQELHGGHDENEQYRNYGQYGSRDQQYHREDTPNHGRHEYDVHRHHERYDERGLYGSYGEEYYGYEHIGSDKFLRYDSDKYNHHRADKYGHHRDEKLDRYDEEEDEDFDNETVDSEEEDYDYDEETILSIKNLLMSTLKNKYKSLGTSFVAMDFEKTGKVTRDVFLGFFEKLGIGAIDHREQNLMFELLKEDREEYITFASFYRCSGESVGSTEQLNQHFISIYGSSRMAFERFFSALKKSTKCTKVDFVAILSEVGISEEKAVSLFEQLDVCKAQSVTVFTMLKMIVGDWDKVEALEYEQKLNTNLSRLLTYLSPESAEDFNSEFSRTLSSHFFDQGVEVSLVTAAYEDFYIDRDLRHFDALCAILEQHDQFKGISLAQKRFIVSLFNIVDTRFGYYSSDEQYSGGLESSSRDNYTGGFESPSNSGFLSDEQYNRDQSQSGVIASGDWMLTDKAPSSTNELVGYISPFGANDNPSATNDALSTSVSNDNLPSTSFASDNTNETRNQAESSKDQAVEVHDVTLISRTEPDPPLVALVSGSLEMKFDGFTYPKSLSLNTPCLANYSQLLACIEKYSREGFRDGFNAEAMNCGYTVTFKVGTGVSTVVGIMPMTSYMYNVLPLLEERSKKLPVIIEFLKCVQSFSVYTPEELERIASACTVKQYKLHETVTRAGEAPTHFYVIFDGSLTLKNEYSFELKCLTKTDLFCANNIVHNKLNNFTLDANCNVVLLSWERNELFRVFARYSTLVENDACNVTDANNLTLQKCTNKRVSFAGIT